MVPFFGDSMNLAGFWLSDLFTYKSLIIKRIGVVILLKSMGYQYYGCLACVLLLYGRNTINLDVQTWVFKLSGD